MQQRIRGRGARGPKTGRRSALYPVVTGTERRWQGRGGNGGGRRGTR